VATLSGCQSILSLGEDAVTDELVREPAPLKPGIENNVQSGVLVGIVGEKTDIVCKQVVEEQRSVTARVPGMNPFLSFDGFTHNGKLYQLTSDTKYMHSTKLTSSRVRDETNISDENIHDIEKFGELEQESVKASIEQGTYTTEQQSRDERQQPVSHTFKLHRHKISNYGRYIIIRNREGVVYKILFSEQSSSLVSFLTVTPVDDVQGKTIEVQFTRDNVSDDSLKLLRKATGAAKSGNFEYKRFRAGGEVKGGQISFPSDFKKTVKETDYIAIDRGLFKLRIE
jgi:hypothetical protein